VIHIEKLNLDVKNKAGWSNPGLIDYFISDFEPSDYAMGFLGKNLYLLSETLQTQLSNYNIRLGKIYGKSGANIETALTDQRSYFEVNHYDVVNSIDITVAKKIFENCNVIVNDFLEGGEFWGSNFLNWLAHYKILPKNLVLQTSGFNFKKFNYPNTKVLPCTHMFALFTLSASGYHDILDDEKREKYIETIKSLRHKKQFQYHAMIPNRKPRLTRVKLLMDLDKANILDKCYWSLAWNNNHKIDELDWNCAEKVWRHQKEILALEDNSIDLKMFLKKYMDTLPKNLDGVENIDTTTGVQIAHTWAGKSKWLIAGEVATVAISKNVPNLKGFITEKSLKAYLLGMPVLSIGTKNTHNALKDMGLPFRDYIDDELEGIERTNAISEFLIKDYKNQIDITEYNKEIVDSMYWFWSKENLSSIISKPLSSLTS